MTIAAQLAIIKGVTRFIMPTRKEKIAQFAKMMFSTAPEFRKSYARPPLLEKGCRIPHHGMFSLVILKKEGKTSMTALAEKLGVSSQQMTRIVSELVDAGLAERSQDETNRRLICISLTPKGRAELSRFFEIGLQHIEAHLSPLSDEELDALLYHMTEVVRLTQKLDE